MDEEQEGIDLEAVNLNNDEGITFPNSTEEEVEETTTQTEQTETNTDSNVDEEERSLKKRCKQREKG